MSDTPVDAQLVAESADQEVQDRDAASPHGQPCLHCGCPIEQGDRFCPACGSSQGEPAPPGAEPDGPQQKFFRCENCGSEVATDPDQRSYVCAFCDSTYVVEFTPEQTGREQPEFVIGFGVTPEQAQEKFGRWMEENAWFRPRDLKTSAIAQKQKGAYLPFWAFSMKAESDWSAQIGEYWYRTETYTTTDSKGKTVTRTRRVRETEWWPLSGKHHGYYSGYLVSGSHGLPQQDADRIKPFNLPALKRYEPYYLAGWLSEEYSVPAERARQTCEQEFRRREQSRVASFLPGDTYRDLGVATRFQDVNAALCLLPVYVLSYRYQDRLYRFLVNGQTGKCVGDKPVSWRRIIGAVAAALAIILLIVLAFNLLA